MKQQKVKKQTTNKPTLTVQEFIDKFPVGSIISFIESKSFIASGARSIFRIDRYEQTPRGYAFMYGIWCGFDFQTTNYKKEYNLDVSNWHCVDCNEDYMATSVENLLFSFNDVRLADSTEKEIFLTCLNNLK